MAFGRDFTLGNSRTRSLQLGEVAPASPQPSEISSLSMITISSCKKSYESETHSAIVVSHILSI